MSRAGLKQVLGRAGGARARALVDSVSSALGITVGIEDLQGTLLHGARSDSPRTAVTLDNADIGWVSGPDGAATIASLLTHLVAKEVEQKALGGEVLHLYREINLIYSFSEKLAALLDVERVAHLTLQEARHLIVATDGMVMLLDEATGELSTAAAFGDEMPALGSFRTGQGIVGAVAASGVGEIVNDLDRDPRRATEHTTIKALVSAPLRVGERVTGIIALGSTIPMHYTAAELKLLNTLALQTGTAIENARLFERTVQAAREREHLLALHQQVEVARAKLESEMKLAARIQSDLFPADMPSIAGYDLAARNRPARQCGGDYYDAVESAGRVLLCVADVAGKGLPASLVMANMQATLRALLGRTESLPALAEQASELLYGSTAPEKYVTAAFADLEPATGAVRFVSAGHVDTLILRASGEVVTLTSTGVPLGLLPGRMAFGEVPLVLAPGDTLVLFSDGVPEAQNGADEEFGEARLVECLRAAAHESASAVIDRILLAIDAFVAGAPQFDDITLLVTRRLP